MTRAAGAPKKGDVVKYRTIVADPPWPYEWRGGGLRKRSRPGEFREPTKREYASMTLPEIKALPVAELAEKDAHLFLWVTNQHYREGVGVHVARAWGFDPIGEIVWEKPNLGMGQFPRLCHEILLVCRRGNLPWTGPFNVRSVQKWRQRYDKNGGKRHSAKPEGAIDLIEQHSPGPYLELFARRHRLGWDVWGNESANTAMLETPA